MPTIKLVAERAATRDVYASSTMRSRRSSAPRSWPVNFRAAAHNPDHLEAYWRQYKAIMEGGSVAKPIKEIIAMVVSALNNCAA